MELDIRTLKKEQQRLAEKVQLQDGFSKIKYIAASDQSIADKKITVAMVVLDYKTMKVVDQNHLVKDLEVNFIPCFSGFIEGPILIELFNNLNIRPDLLIVEGPGIAHQRRIGIASHVGLMLDIPTIGVTKKLAIGCVHEGKVYFEKEIRGFEIRTKEFANPIYISPGHKISTGTALGVIKECLKGHKLPEPMQKCHKYLNSIKTKEQSNNNQEIEKEE